MERAQEILETVFGFKQFRLHQREIVSALVSGRDVLALMPTGGGKSLCYQIPALVRKGTAIVVSPLIALMQDQVAALGQVGVNAAFLNSTLEPWAQRVVEEELLQGRIDLLYIAPERLVGERTIMLLSECNLALFAIDEAHCVSQWGHDFRPEYRQLSCLADRFPDVPRIALTATADVRTREEIVEQLRLREAEKFIASFDRPNIRYTITDGDRARERLWRFIATNHAGEAGIVYCLSRKKVEETADWLNAKGRTALAYHAGLASDLRHRHQERFLREEGIIIVATIAFGMGIDKPDVRFVAHLNLPKSIEAYYQETGRAGRDGAPANAWMAYRVSDAVTYRQWIEQSDAGDVYKRVSQQKLEALIGLCEMTTCRRRALLGYFDEERTEPCGNCDNCLSPPETSDATEAARKALSVVYRTGQRFGAGYAIDVLMGKTNARITSNGHHRLAVFGVGADLARGAWQGIFRQLIAEGHLEAVAERYGGLRLTDRCRPLLRGETTFLTRSRPKPEPKERGRRRDRERKRAAPDVAPGDRPLFEALRATRLRLASEQDVPPFVICPDTTLKELAWKRPETRVALHDINGLGATKIERYGAALLETVRDFPDHPLLANSFSPTVNLSLGLHLQGLDASRIAEIRGLEEQTILGHFAEAIELGTLQAQDVLALDAGERDEILAKFDEHETRESGQLKPVHEALGGRYDYGTLKCLLAEVV